MVAQGLAAHMSQYMLSAYFALEDESVSDVVGKVITKPYQVRILFVVDGLSQSLQIRTSEEAFQFIHFLTNTENNRKLALEFGNGPVRRSPSWTQSLRKHFPFAEELVVALDSGQSQYFNAPTIAIWIDSIKLSTRILPMPFMEMPNPRTL